MAKKEKKYDYRPKSHPLDDKQQMSSNSSLLSRLLQMVFTQNIGKAQFKFLVGYSLLIVLLEFCASLLGHLLHCCLQALDAWAGHMYCRIIYMFVRLVIEDLKAKHISPLCSCPLFS